MSSSTLTVPNDATLTGLPSTPRPPNSYTPKAKPWLRFPTSFEHILAHNYPGKGTSELPYLVSFIDHDPENPLTYSDTYKWFVVGVASITTLAVALASSAYSGGIRSSMVDWGASQELLTAGISLFVLGFAFGPVLWAPLSEIFGRRKTFIVSYAFLTLWCGVAIASQNVAQLLVFRFFAGFFGSSPLANSGGTVSDVFTAKQRGLGLAAFAAAPFLGPALGPIIGGFIGEKQHGWRWIEVFLCCLCGVLALAGTLLSPETYAPVILRARAHKLSKLTGLHYRYVGDAAKPLDPKQLFKSSLTRPWVFLFCEPIVFFLSLYMACVYGILYMLFPAFPIIFQQGRGWSSGIGGLAFLGILVGMIFAVAFVILYDNPRYVKIAEASPTGRATPEDRLPPAILGAILLPVSLGWFAGTNGPSVHWIVPIIATVPFGFGMVLVFLSQMNFLVDTYTIYAASVLAANSVLRSLFGAAFPLFVTYMYQNLGVHWATAVPGFIALVCVPLPIIFYKKGAAIRARGKYASPAIPGVTVPAVTSSEKAATSAA